ncbi:MAG: hypothetical protein U9Q98_04420 [Bacteroidota bacterium]|nr:hypothetical protein [Bacteroidota bacterium]
MKTNELLKEINQLPTRKRIFLIEKMIQSIRKQDENDQMQKAVDSLYSDYMHDNELTAFTDIDFENFYETR